MTTAGKAQIKTRRWRDVRPRSVTGLLLASFALVALPMLAATLFGVVYVDRLADQSERLVLRGVQAARAARRLDTILTNMERNARQYKILEKPVFTQRFSQQKKAFENMLDTLRGLHLKSMPSWNLTTLSRQAQTIAAAVDGGPYAVATVLELFDTMHKKVALITEQVQVFIDSELQRLQETARQARLFLLLCVVMLIPGTVLLAIVFTVVISRPVRQVNKAIDRLGKGDLGRAVKVAAPSAEFDALGSQLDWMRRRLATLEDERNQFQRHMSHELKTPLASIREGTELLRDGTVGTMPHRQTEVVDIIQRNSLELLALIENLLDFSAWRQQQVQLEYSRFDLRELVETVVQRQKLTIEGKRLSVSLPEATLALTADRERVHLILDNLLTNAVKFSPEHGTIGVDAKEGRDLITISVCDQGPGIAADEHGRIFDAFYQGAKACQQGPVRGTGIGLSVVSECVQAHDGRIEVTDSAAGGACFQVTLPTRRAGSHAH